MEVSMRADRLLSILLLLQTHDRLTAGQLAERLEVSERTIYRDMDALGAAGIPVLAERGSNGGWALLDSYRTDLTGLNPPEIQALFVTQSARLLDDLGLRGAAEGALIKLLAALPSVHQRDAEFVRQHIYVDGAGWRDTPENTACLPVVQEAIWAGRKLTICYQRTDGEAVERLVNPLGLVAKGRIWYLIAGVEEDIRTYRISRIDSAHLSQETFLRPPDFDLAAHWKQSSIDFKANLPKYPAVLRVHPDAVPRLGGLAYASVGEIEPPGEKGWQRVSMLFQILEVACEQVLTLGPLAEVLEPLELRQRVITVAKGIVGMYEGNDGA
jgi:predicted DNA-binding transcriptional regulator YafY